MTNGQLLSPKSSQPGTDNTVSRLAIRVHAHVHGYVTPELQ
jgi:hypothetical protein